MVTLKERPPVSKNFKYVIYPEKSLIVETITGTVTVSELLEFSQHLWKDPDYRKEYGGIIDATEATTRLSMSDLRSMGTFYQGKPLVSLGRWAMITSGPMESAIGKIFRNFKPSSFPFEIVSTWEDACKFLEIPVFPKEI